ncbi:MAG: protein-L-isoaspartate(D-aspartate) O-methyltransferase [Mesorhizobium sp.]
MSAVADEREGFAAFLLRMRGKGIVAKDLISAIEQVPRRNFIGAQWQSAVWSDRLVPIACGEVIEGIDLQAQVINALSLDPQHRVLEIGTGSGFTAAVMARLCARVVSIDRYRTLVEQARHRIDALGIGNVILRQADANGGMAGEGPFDRIVSWAAFESMPRSYVDQLASGGIMIAPIGPGDGEQAVARLTKVGSRFERHDIGKVRLQPLLPGLAARL